MNAEQMQLLSDWNAAVVQINAVKYLFDREKEARARVMASFFPTPKEGVNTAPLEDGWVLKGTYKLDRKVDEAALPAAREQLALMNINADSLINMKPSLNTQAYRSLVTINPEAAKVFEEALIIKPASPTVELIPPKEKA
jgi:hypothetical protein